MVERHAERDPATNRFKRSKADLSQVKFDVPWDEFVRDHFRWAQGEHMTLIGPTGAGKTTLALELLTQRRFVVALATKPYDDTMSSLVKRDGWVKAPTWSKVPKPRRADELIRAVLWPPYQSRHDAATQAVILEHALTEMFVAGGWTVFADELFWLKKLGLDPDLEAWWSQGRSSKLTLVAGTQRPAHVSLMAYDMATHVFLWRDNDVRNLKRLSELNGQNTAAVREVVANLPRHATLYVNTRTGDMVTTTAPKRK